jgi:hypothetical protein
MRAKANVLLIGDLLFNGVTPFARRSTLAEGVQADASWRINDSHTLRGGFLGQVETTAFDATSSVLPVDSTGAQTSIVPDLQHSDLSACRIHGGQLFRTSSSRDCPISELRYTNVVLHSHCLTWSM